MKARTWYYMTIMAGAGTTGVGVFLVTRILRMKFHG